MSLPSPNDSAPKHSPPDGFTIQTLAPVSRPEDLGNLPGLAGPDLGNRLPHRPPPGSWLSALALGESGVAGMVVVEISDGEDDEPVAAHLLSLVVAPAHRRQGLGHALLATAEEMAREAGAGELYGSYRTSWDSQPAVEALIEDRDWGTPETRMIIARGETDRARRLIEAKGADLPEEAEIVPLKELSYEELESVLDAPQTNPGAIGSMPMEQPDADDAPKLEPKVSVALRWKGRVAGFLVCHRLSTDTLQYSSFFVRSDLRQRGLGWALVREAVRRRLEDPSLRHAILTVDARNKRVRSLVEEHLGDYLESVSELKVSSKQL